MEKPAQCNVQLLAGGREQRGAARCSSAISYPRDLGESGQGATTRVSGRERRGRAAGSTTRGGRVACPAVPLSESPPFLSS